MTIFYLHEWESIVTKAMITKHNWKKEFTIHESRAKKSERQTRKQIKVNLDVRKVAEKNIHICHT